MKGIFTIVALYKSVHISPHLFTYSTLITIGFILSHLFSLLFNLRDNSFPQESNAIFSSTETFSIRSLKCIHIIIKGELFTFFYISKCKNTNASLPPDIPFFSLTIGITAMVNEPGHISDIGRVNNLILSDFHQICHIGSFVSLPSGLSNCTIQAIHLSHILKYKLSFFNLLSCRQPPAFVGSSYRKCLHILLSLKPTISTELPTFAAPG